MKKFFLLLFVAASIIACAQKQDEIINAKEVQRIESVLASDDMRGRKAGTPDIDRAAGFIANEFKAAGLQPFQGNSFLQPFVMLHPVLTSLKFEVNGADADTKNVIVITSEPELKVNEKSGYAIEKISSGDNFFQRAQAIIHSDKNTIAFVDPAFAQNFSRLINFKRQMFKSNVSTIFILSSEQPQTFTIKAEHKFDETKYANVVGILPGKSKKDQYVIFRSLRSFRNCTATHKWR